MVAPENPQLAASVGLETENGFIHSTPHTHISNIHILPGASLVYM